MVNILEELLDAQVGRMELGLPDPDAISLLAPEFDELVAEYENALVVKRKLVPSDAFLFCGQWYYRVPPRPR